MIQFLDEFDDDGDESVDTCLGCGGTAWAHAGVRAWDATRERSIAPQLCPRCWQQQGYPWPKAKASEGREWF